MQIKNLRIYFVMDFFKQTYKFICKNDESKQQKRGVLIWNRVTTISLKINACVDLTNLAWNWTNFSWS